MTKVWTPALAIVLMLIGLGNMADAQGPEFAQDPAAAMMGPQFCPDGPPPVVESRIPFQEPLPLFNAFDEAKCEIYPVHYFGVGGMALMRGRLSNRPLAVLDPGINVPGVPSNVDTGNLPPPNAPVAARFNLLPQDFQWGVQTTLGWQYGAHAIEFSGYYIPDQTQVGTVIAPGRLDLPFANFPPPLGFVGNNSLWLQADSVTVELRTQTANAEVNHRVQWNPWLEAMWGLRYFDVRDQFRIITDDDGVALNVVDPLRVATVQAQTVSRIVGPQFGFETMHYLVPSVAVGLTNKNMVGANFLDVNNRLFRGDGFEGPSAVRETTQVSGLVELEVHLLIMLNQHIRFRAAYQALWVWNVPQAQEQISFNLADPGGAENDKDNIFYHGPRLELQFAW